MFFNYKLWIIGLLMLVVTMGSAMASNHTVIESNIATNLDIIRGEVILGSIESTHIFNNDYLSISEVNVSNGLLFSVIFEGVKGDVQNLFINAKYEGGASHEVLLEVYDFVLDDWFLLKTYGNSPNFVYDIFDISFINVVDGEVLLRFNHPQSGISSHSFDIDYLVISSEVLVSDKDLGLFSFDFDDTFVILVFGLFMVIGALLVFIRPFIGSILLGGLIYMILGLVLIFNEIMALFGLILLLSGFIGLFVED